MDANNWRPNPPGGEPAVDTDDWRAQLRPDSRQSIVKKIMETLNRHLPFSGQEGLQELKKIAIRFEQKTYSAAESKQDYLQKITSKMLTLEKNYQNSMPIPLQSDSQSSTNMPPNPASHNTPSQLHNPGQSLPMQLASSQQARQQLLSQDMQNNITTAGVQSWEAMFQQNSNPSVGEPAVDTGVWRAQLQPDSRQTIVNRIMETLNRNGAFSGQEGLQDLKRIAATFEEQTYSTAVSQQDYLRKISLKMITMKNLFHNSMPDSMSNSNMPPDRDESLPQSPKPERAS